MKKWPDMGLPVSSGRRDEWLVRERQGSKEHRRKRKGLKEPEQSVYSSLTSRAPENCLVIKAKDR